MIWRVETFDVTSALISRLATPAGNWAAVVDAARSIEHDGAFHGAK
jgi:hypothetical protein